MYSHEGTSKGLPKSPERVAEKGMETEPELMFNTTARQRATEISTKERRYDLGCDIYCKGL
jgi:hypothetical protein